MYQNWTAVLSKSYSIVSFFELTETPIQTNFLLPSQSESSQCVQQSTVAWCSLQATPTARSDIKAQYIVEATQLILITQPCTCQPPDEPLCSG